MALRLSSHLNLDMFTDQMLGVTNASWVEAAEIYTVSAMSIDIVNSKHSVCCISWPIICKPFYTLRVAQCTSIYKQK